MRLPELRLNTKNYFKIFFLLNMPHNILFYYPYNKTMTGGPLVLLSLLELLDKNKFYPLVVTQKQSPLVDELKKRKIEVLVISLPSILEVQDSGMLKYGLLKKLWSFFYLMRYNLLIYRLIKKRSIKLIWARNIKAVLFVGFATRLTSAKLIWDIGLGDKFKGFVKFLHFIGLNLSDFIVTEGKSQHVKMFGKVFTRLYSKKLLHILPGIDQGRIKFIDRLSKHKNSPSFRIISIATISPRKNQKMLLCSLEKLIVSCPQVHVSFVGPFPDQKYYQELLEYVHAAGLEPFVSFLGWRKDIPELLRSSDLLVLCSYNEGIPQAIVEAMHAGLPVIATRVGGIPDAIVEGKTGFLVEVDDRAEMTQKLQYLIQHPEIRQEMGRNSKFFARQNFTYQAYYQKYDIIFSKLIPSTYENDKYSF